MSSPSTKALEPNATGVILTDRTLTKKQRGRHKKLRKLAVEEKEGCETTGISTNADWKEFVGLDSSASLTARPAVRQRRRRLERQNAEGSHHRDLIYQVLHRTNHSKKRANIEIGNSIPSWATLHNVAAVESLVVIELQLKLKVGTNWESTLEKLPILKTGALPVATRWFQGPRPKSMTDALMYLAPSSPSESSKKRKIKDGSDNVHASFADLLNPLILTTKERRKEGFPMENEIRDLAQPLDRLPVEFELKLPTHKQAKLIVSQYQAPAILGDAVTNSTFVRTCHEQRDQHPKVYALDCEMVQTLAGTELARITLIQLVEITEDGTITHKVMLDELVKPHQPVLDYVTKYSGVTAEIMNPVETRLEQIQAFLVQLLNKNDIIVGHSLQNDFRAAQLIHDCVVDTSHIFRGNDGRKYALRHLTAALLKRTIQNADGGHCSEEDAVASLELAIQRARKGPSFRIFQTKESRLHLLECLKHDQDHPIVCIGPSKWLNTYVTRFSTSAHALTCETVEDDNRKAISAWLVNAKRRSKLVWANLLISGEGDGLDQTNQILADLLKRALPGTLVVVALQSGLECAVAQTAERDARMNPRASLRWTEDEERIWQESSDRARSGLAFWLGRL